ncbi:TPA: hypothetical protein KQE54_002217, partial [Clostridioides difficile]|nr:hypothetical protein [Clostridioides difficile]
MLNEDIVKKLKNIPSDTNLELNKKATINDTEESETTTYSSKKIKNLVDNIENTANKITIEDAANNFTTNNVEGALNELFQSVSNGKKLIATAITDKKVPTNSSDTFQTMAGNISSIKQMPDMPNDIEEIWKFTGHTRYVLSVTIDSQGNIISGSSDNTVRKISTNGVGVWTFTGNSSSVYSVCVDPKDNIYSSGADKTVRKISTNGNEIWKFTGHTNTVQSVCVDSQNNIISGGYDG